MDYLLVCGTTIHILNPIGEKEKMTNKILVNLRRLVFGCVALLSIYNLWLCSFVGYDAYIDVWFILTILCTFKFVDEIRG